MKRSRLAALLFILALAAGCGKEDEESIIPGYLKPGEFREKGILVKSYTFTDTSPTGFDPADASCSGEECLAVYAFWAVSNIPVEGVAVKDNNTINSSLLLKITRVKGASWNVRLVYEGTEYTTPIGGTTNLALELCSMNHATNPLLREPTLPFYDPTPAEPDSGDELDESETFLSRARLTVTADIPLRTEDDSKTITLRAGDEIVAQAYNAFATESCGP